MFNKNYVSLHVHSDYSFLDSVAKIEDLTRKAKSLNMPGLAITEHGNICSWLKFYEHCKKQEIKPIFGCLLKGQEIITIDGAKNIEDIKIGDLVLTHKGRFKKVTRLMKREYVGSVYEIELNYGYSRKLKLTEEHPILIRDISGKLKWKKPNELKFGLRTKDGGIDNWNSYVCFPKLEVSKNDLEIDKDMAYFLGLYVAEGCVSKNKDGKIRSDIYFTFNASEKKYQQFIKTFLKNRYDINCWERIVHNGTTIQIVASSVTLAKKLHEMCGHGAKNKKIPHVIFSCSNEIKLSFINGLVDGDGRSLCESNKLGIRSLKTASKNLAWGFKVLTANLGCWSTITNTKSFGGDIIKSKEIFDGFSISYHPNKKSIKFLEDNDYIYRPIKNITSNLIKTEVYNFEVEEDHSYVSDFVLHNCEFYICDDALLPSNIDNKVEELEQRLSSSMGSLFDWAGAPEEYESEKKLETIQEALEENTFDVKSQIEFLKEHKTKVKKSNHLILLAKNRTGYDNIMKLSSYGYQKGLFYKPRIDMKILEKHKDGLIVLSACLGGQISSNILKGRIEKAEEYVKEYKRIFGEDFYLELQLHEIEEQRTANKGLIELMKKYKVQPVITQDVHYVEKEDLELHEIVIKLKNKRTDADEKETEAEKAQEEAEVKAEDEEDSDGYFYTARGLYFKSYDELVESWKQQHDYIHEKIFNKAIDNTMVIFDKVENFPVRSEKPLLPNYDTEGLTARDFILKLIKAGAKEKLSEKIKATPSLKQVYEARMIEELNTICELKFEQYFLIVWDIMNWCKEHDIMTGPGRGSAAGSLIAYLLGITHLDPIEHDLLFSRFINKSRSGARFQLEFQDIPMKIFEKK